MRRNKFIVLVLCFVLGFTMFSMDTFAEMSSFDVQASNGTWIQDSATGKWWYRHSDGSYTINNWEYINGHWYWFDSAGWMQTGWIIVDGYWYYLGEDGSMVTGWLYYNKKWYYLNTYSGEMVSGWQRINEHWYWFDQSGIMTTGHRKISDIDYYFYSNGVLAYDASLTAAIYTKNYGSGNINTLPDSDIVIGILTGKYRVERHDNFVKSDFTSTNNVFNTNNLNRGILFYSGHGGTNGAGLALGDGYYLTPTEIKKLNMNNTKVAFFFACYCGLRDSSGDSVASAAVKAGANASFAYRVSSDVAGDRNVARVIFTEMMNSRSLTKAVEVAQSRYMYYTPIKEGNYVIEGSGNTIISDTYAINSIEGLFVPDGYVYKGNGNSIDLYVLMYNGYETSDKFIYDSERGQYVFERKEIDESRLSEIDFNAVEKNGNLFDANHIDKEYENYFDIITLFENNPTVVRVCSYINNDILEYDCFDLQSNQNITEKVNLFDDIM